MYSHLFLSQQPLLECSTQTLGEEYANQLLSFELMGRLHVDHSAHIIQLKLREQSAIRREKGLKVIITMKT